MIYIYNNGTVLVLIGAKNSQSITANYDVEGAISIIIFFWVRISQNIAMHSILTGIGYYAYMGVVSYFDYFEDTNISHIFLFLYFKLESMLSFYNLYSFLGRCPSGLQRCLLPRSLSYLV